MSQHTHNFSAWPFSVPVETITFCTAKVAHQGYPALLASHDHNGDWQFLDDTADEPGECVLLCFGCMYQRDTTLAEISDLPAGWSAARAQLGANWERWEQLPEEVEEEQGHKCASAAEGEAKALADIAAYGLHVISVLADEQSLPFTYSIGIEQSLGLPELIVVGLKPKVAHSAINECYRQMKAKPSMGAGSRVEDLLGGDFQCLIGEVAPEQASRYMHWATWLYKGNNFRARQIIYPSTLGAFPWEPQASDWFRNSQPLLADSAASR